jgi:hypothetical protein
MGRRMGLQRLCEVIRHGNRFARRLLGRAMPPPCRMASAAAINLAFISSAGGRSSRLAILP